MISRVGQSAIRQARTQLRPRTGPTPVASLSALARLLSSLAVLEQKDGKLNHGSLSAVTAAQKLGGSITAFVAGGNIKGVAEQAAKVGGIEKIIAVDNAAYDKVRLRTFFLWRNMLMIFIGIARELCPIVGREH
jgi:electron transfer flavoprotein alpha subunit